MSLVFRLCLVSLLYLGAVLAPAWANPKPTLTIGVPSELPPLSLHVPSDRAMRGLLVDFGELLAARLGCTATFLEGGPGRLERLLRQGRVDCIMGIPSLRLSPTTEGMVFTPLALNRRIITCPPYPAISSEKDFSGRRILLTHYDMGYSEIVRRRGGTVVRADSVAEALERLCAGEGDAFVTYSGEVALGQAQRHGIGHLKIMGLALERIPITIRLSTGHPELEAAITTALVALENAGELDLLRDKWLGQALVEKNLWERYRNRIWGSLCAVLAVSALGLIWIFTLRRQVARTTEALRRSERRFRELFAGSPDVALLLDANGGIHLANRVARDLLDIPRGPLVGSSALLDVLCVDGKKSLLTLLHSHVPSNAEAAPLDCGSHSTGGGPTSVTLTLRPGAAKLCIVEFLAFTADAEDADASHVPLVCCLGRDLTMHKRLEKELIDAERLAIIGKTAACVAHEINNPLGIIMANTGVLLEETDNPAQLRLLKAISRNVDRAAATTRRMLNIAMPKETNMVTQNLRELIEETLSFIGPRLKRVEVDLCRLPATVTLTGDRTMLEQVFTNLILNALNSMEDSGWLGISAQVLAEAPPKAFDYAARQPELIGILEEQMFSERWLLVEIADSGRGIDPSQLHCLFDPFFTTRGEGFGLGLWISRRIVELHKGLIYAQSDPDKGMVVSMVFSLGGTENR